MPRKWLFTLFYVIHGLALVTVCLRVERTINLKSGVLTQIKLPSMSDVFRTATRFNGKFTILAPENHIPSVTCENPTTTVTCTEGSLLVLNGTPRRNNCRNSRGTQQSQMELVVNARQGHEQETGTMCLARSIPRPIPTTSGVSNSRTTITITQRQGSGGASATAVTTVANGRNDGAGRNDGSRQTTCACGWTNSRSRIVGGVEANVNEFPLVAGLIVWSTRQRFCGGSIITNSHILTAAHCMDDVRSIPIGAVVGDHDMNNIRQTPNAQTLRITRRIQHEGWDRTRLVHDIAILVTGRKITFNQQVGPTCLPADSPRLIGETVTAMGWGLTRTPNERQRGKLRKVDLRVVNIRTCSARYGNALNTRTVTQICTYERNRDTCQGDSGGPLIWRDPDTSRFTQVALVSFGRECGSNSPAVNTRVRSYMNWIRRQVSRTASDATICTKV